MSWIQTHTGIEGVLFFFFGRVRWWCQRKKSKKMKSNKKRKVTMKETRKQMTTMKRKTVEGMKQEWKNSEREE